MNCGRTFRTLNIVPSLFSCRSEKILCVIEFEQDEN